MMSVCGYTRGLFVSGCHTGIVSRGQGQRLAAYNKEVLHHCTATAAPEGSSAATAQTRWLRESCSLLRAI